MLLCFLTPDIFLNDFNNHWKFKFKTCLIKICDGDSRVNLELNRSKIQKYWQGYEQSKQEKI